MKTRLPFGFIFLSILFCSIGYMCSVVLYFPSPKIPEIYVSPQYFNFKFNAKLFLKILTNNFFVGLLLSVVGYATAGIITGIVLVYNGFMLGIIIQNALTSQIPNQDLIYLLILHGPIEFLSLLYLSTIGFKGWYMYQKILISNFDLTTHDLPDVKSLILPNLGLIISAAIEASIVK